jgi:hypothetical protein
MFFKSKAPEKDKNAAANPAEVMGMVQQQHSVVEQVAASPPVPKAGTGSCMILSCGGVYRRATSRV